jgi:hypothetical protein
MTKLEYEHMFDSETLVSTRERAAVLALMARRKVQWNRLAGSIEEAGSALALLEELEEANDPRLFAVESAEITLDQLEERVISYEQEGIRLITVLDAAYPMNLRMVHDRPPALFARGELSPADERSVAVVGSRKASPAGLERLQRSLGIWSAATMLWSAASLLVSTLPPTRRRWGRVGEPWRRSAPAYGITSQSRTRSCRSDLAVRAPLSPSSGPARKHVVGRSPSATL